MQYNTWIDKRDSQVRCTYGSPIHGTTKATLTGAKSKTGVTLTITYAAISLTHGKVECIGPDGDARAGIDLKPTPPNLKKLLPTRMTLRYDDYDVELPFDFYKGSGVVFAYRR